jgi:Fe-S cluster assembly ATP-binding protein
MYTPLIADESWLADRLEWDSLLLLEWNEPMRQTTTTNGAPQLSIRGLSARVAGTEDDILRGVDLEIFPGQIHALMGPNGSGKSTLAKVLSGHPGYEASAGEVLFKGRNLLELEPDERARLGLFMAFQYPMEVPGVSIANFLRTALNARRPRDDEVSVLDFYDDLQEQMARLKMEETFAERFVNEGFSGGEKKRSEILQMAVLKPDLAVLDETDSGLDVDALRLVAEGVNTLVKDRRAAAREGTSQTPPGSAGSAAAAAGAEGGSPSEITQPTEMSVLLITHYQRVLNYITPDRVHIMYRGRLVRSGGSELALEIEKHGYDFLREESTAALDTEEIAAAAPR